MHERDTDRASRLCERVYGLLLAAYPRRFRDTYGSQMAQAFSDPLREERQRGDSAWLIRIWGRALSDLAVSALAQRRNDLGRTSDEEAALSKGALAAVGFVFILAPLFFVTASVLKYGLGVGILFDPLESLLADPQRLHWFNLVSPVVFLGGLVLALALNAYAVLRFSVGRERDEVVSTVKLKMKLANIAVAAISFSLLVTLMSYVFLENLTQR
jgi:hypothetical protein